MQLETHTKQTFGGQLKTWRQRRRRSQLDFALDAAISQKHLSFIETGRAKPSREMVIRLAECLEIPLRERNTLLLAAGYAPVYSARSFDDASLAEARAAIKRILESQEPFPALAIDRHWNMVAANRAVAPLLAAVRKPELIAGNFNVLRVSLHPEGIAPNIVNLAAWRRHLLERLRQQIAVTADPVLIELLGELKSYPSAGHPSDKQNETPDGEATTNAVFITLRYATPAGQLALFSTTTIFGTPVDVTLSEIAIESFFPADRATRDILLAGR